MKKVSKILLIAMLCTGFASCVEDSYDEIQDDSIMVPASTDPDDEDNTRPPTIDSETTNN